MLFGGCVYAIIWQMKLTPKCCQQQNGKVLPDWKSIQADESRCCLCDICSIVWIKSLYSFFYNLYALCLYVTKRFFLIEMKCIQKSSIWLFIKLEKNCRETAEFNECQKKSHMKIIHSRMLKLMAQTYLVLTNSQYKSPV